MPTIARLRVRLEGFVGAPGVSTFYAVNEATFRPALVAFWTAMVTRMPLNVKVTVENSGDLLDEGSGLNTGTWTDGAVVALEGSAIGPYSAPSGAAVTWHTTIILNGRRVKGRTFVVPLRSEFYGPDGSLDDTTLNVLRAAAAALVAASPGSMLIYHRPTDNVVGVPAGPGGSPPAVPSVPGTDGQGCPVVSSTISDKAAVLRSRRG